jgi:putative lipoic acid-binding regulatory protein
MNIGPQQIVQLIQVNEKLKEKVQALEQDRLRFISVMAEVKLSHQQELETLAKKLAEQNLLKVLFGQLGGQPSNEEKPEELEKSE